MKMVTGLRCPSESQGIEPVLPWSQVFNLLFENVSRGFVHEAYAFVLDANPFSISAVFSKIAFVYYSNRNFGNNLKCFLQFSWINRKRDQVNAHFYFDIVQ